MIDDLKINKLMLFLNIQLLYYVIFFSALNDDFGVGLKALNAKIA